VRRKQRAYGKRRTKKKQVAVDSGKQVPLGERDSHGLSGHEGLLPPRKIAAAVCWPLTAVLTPLLA